MDRVLVHSSLLLPPVAGSSHKSIEPQGSLKIMCTLRGFSALGNSVKLSGLDLHSKVAKSVILRTGKHGRRCAAKALFERFTDKAIDVVKFAQKESTMLGHDYVGTEHILLSLISKGSRLTTTVLKLMGISLENARVEVVKMTAGRGNGSAAVESPFTLRARLVLELSLEEAHELGHKYIGPEHLLLALLREPGCVAARVLENLCADPSKIREEIIGMFRLIRIFEDGSV